MIRLLLGPPLPLNMLGRRRGHHALLPPPPPLLCLRTWRPALLLMCLAGGRLSAGPVQLRGGEGALSLLVLGCQLVDPEPTVNSGHIVPLLCPWNERPPPLWLGVRLCVGRLQRHLAPSAASPMAVQPENTEERVTATRGSGYAQLKGRRPPSTVGGARGPRSFPIVLEVDKNMPGHAEPESSAGRTPAATSFRQSSDESGEVSSDDGDEQSTAVRPALRSQLGSGSAAARDSARRQPGKSHSVSASLAQGVGIGAGEQGGSQGGVTVGLPVRDSGGVLGLAEFFCGLS